MKNWYSHTLHIHKEYPFYRYKKIHRKNTSKTKFPIFFCEWALWRCVPVLRLKIVFLALSFCPLSKKYVAGAVEPDLNQHGVNMLIRLHILTTSHLETNQSSYHHLQRLQLLTPQGEVQLKLRTTLVSLSEQSLSACLPD